jgi:hypothetical protein
MRAADAYAQEALTHLQGEFDATARQAAEADNRSNALSADLDEARARDGLSRTASKMRPLRSSGCAPNWVLRSIAMMRWSSMRRTRGEACGAAPRGDG